MKENVHPTGTNPSQGNFFH